MVSSYASRIYFSRYFFSTFKVNLKCRKKISDYNSNFFYSDPYYFKHKLTTYGQLNFSGLSDFQKQDAYKRARSYLFPIKLVFPNSLAYYDISWFQLAITKDLLLKIFTFFIKLRFDNLIFCPPIKLYINYFKKN